MEREQLKRKWLKNETLEARFELIDYCDDWSYFSSPYYHFVNKNYEGSETTTVTSTPSKILKFLRELVSFNSEYLKFVKEFELRYWVGNEFRGRGGDVSKLVIDKEFANRIKIRGCFRWIDRAWGDYYGVLEYDLSQL